jgi:hypothetical protein
VAVPSMTAAMAGPITDSATQSGAGRHGCLREDGQPPPGGIRTGTMQSSRAGPFVQGLADLDRAVLEHGESRGHVY